MDCYRSVPLSGGRLTGPYCTLVFFNYQQKIRSGNLNDCWINLNFQLQFAKTEIRTSDPILLVKSCPQISVQVGRLIVNGVVVGVEPLFFLKCNPTKKSSIEKWGQKMALPKTRVPKDFNASERKIVSLVTKLAILTLLILLNVNSIYFRDKFQFAKVSSWCKEHCYFMILP